MLVSANREYDQQQRLAALAVEESLRLSTRGSRAVAQSVNTYQAAAIALSLQWLTASLAEQGIDAAQDATVNAASLLTGTQALVSMLDAAPSPVAMTRLVQTMVGDAQRTARAVDSATRSAVTGYVRFLRLPSCGRCVILAGRVYRYSTGFLRHPNDDCGMMPTTHTIGRHLVTDPREAFDRGQVSGLSAAEVEAIKAGADMGQVVNVRRKAAGMTIGSSVIQRAGRLTPQGCMQFASDRADMLRLLRIYGYVT